MLPGLYNYSDKLRQHLLSSLIVKDDGAIPAKKKYSYTLPCGLAHPGICATRHAWCLPQVKAATKSISAQLCSWAQGGFWKMRAQSESGMQKWDNDVESYRYRA